MHRLQSPPSRRVNNSSRRGRTDRSEVHPDGQSTPEPPRTRHRRASSNHSQKKYQKAPEYERHAGAEPGIDPRRGAANAEYSHFKEECIIDVIDYDDEDVYFERMGNEQFIKFLQGPGNSQPGVLKGSEDDVPPQAVRWINIEGIDWKVLSNVALRYNLDSLALEDILHERGHNHSKADYYPNHLFLRILCHTLEQPPSYVELESFERLDSLPLPDRDSLSPLRLPSYNTAEQGKGRVNSVLSTGVLGDLDTVTGDASGQSVLKPYIALAPENDQSLLPGDPLQRSDTKEESENDSNPKSMARKRPRPFSSLKQAVRKRLSSLSGYHSSARREQEARLKELKKDHRIEIRKEPMFIFLLTNGTVISIHPSPDNDYTAPISERLHHIDSVLRISSDASLLVESLIDLIVDRILEVMDEYQMKIGDLEREILISPGMDAVRSLHILSGDLITHKRTLDPIKTMIYGLRKYDLDRSIALHENLAIANREQQARDRKREHAKGAKKGKRHRQQQQQQHDDGHLGIGPVIASSKLDDIRSAGHGESSAALLTTHGRSLSSQALGDEHGGRSSPAPSGGVLDHGGEHSSSLLRNEHQVRAMAMAGNVNGFLSYKSKVYLADVYDHMEFALTSLDMFADTTQNLINYAFNIASYNMNIVMSRLTLITIIFLPLTLLTGYFGMNFSPFWSVEKNSDIFFWKLAVPIMAVLIPLFMVSEIKESYKSWQRRRHDHLAIKELRQAVAKGVAPGSMWMF